MSLFDELKRRNVFRVGAAYVVVAWLIIQVVETIFPLYGLPDSSIRIVITVVAIGLIPTLIFAWAFEHTPEGLMREKDVDRSRSITNHTGRKLDRIIIAILVLALGYFIVDKFIISAPDAGDRFAFSSQPDAGQAIQERKTIAVLPFANMSGDPVNEPFTLGIHDDLLTHLSRIKSLKTTSRTSVLQYRDTTKTIPEIAAELSVSNILEGGIQRSGDRVRINLQLIDAATDEHLWAEIYDRELTAENLFSVQGEIAAEVVKSMRATLLPEEQSALAQTPTSSMAAYDLYLLGRHHWKQRTAESIGMARDYFARAIEEDPEYVLALSGLSDSYALLVNYGNMEGADAFPLAHDAVDSAMALDDSLSEVWASLGLLQLLQNKLPEAAKTLEHAIELDEQNFSAWLWYGNVMSSMRRFEEQLKALQNAYALEPMSPPINNNLAGGYRARGDFVRARQHFERSDQLDDLNLNQYKDDIAATYYWSGDLSRAIVDSRAILSTDPGNVDSLRLLVDTYLALDDIPEADRWAQQAAKIHSFDPIAYRVYLAQEDFDGAMEYIEDKLVLMQNRKNIGYLHMLFRAAYMGNRIESAKSYVAEYLGHLGGRREINPSAIFHWDNLLLADFLIKHGNDDAGEPRQGRKMLNEVISGLSNLREQGYEHPGTYFGLALAWAMKGNETQALDALEGAVERGFRDRLMLSADPTLSSVRDTERFRSITMRMEDLIALESERLAQTELAPYTPLSDRELVMVPRETLETYAGYYSDGNVVIHIYLDQNGRLTGRPGQMRSFTLLASSQDEFYVELVPSDTLKFHLDEGGTVTHLNVNNAGGVQRLKAIDPPPSAVQLEVEVLERYQGTFAAQLISDAKDGSAESDTWTALIGIDEKGKAWIDFDDQPRLEILPYSETEFYIPGFVTKFKFEIDAESGKANRMLYIQDGTELEFLRQ